MKAMVPDTEDGFNAPEYQWQGKSSLRITVELMKMIDECRPVNEIAKALKIPTVAVKAAMAAGSRE